LAALQAHDNGMSQNRQRKRQGTIQNKNYMANFKSGNWNSNPSREIDHHYNSNQQQELLNIQQIQVEMMEDK